MEIAHLKYFFKVAKHRSFTKASKALRVAQPSVSRTVRNLEEQLGLLLLHRTKRSVVLTEIGEQFYKSCELIFGEIANLRETASSYGKECAGILRVGASDNICNYLLPKFIGRFLDTYPKAGLKLFSGTSNAIKAEILNERAELGLFYTPLSLSEKKSLEAESLGFVRFDLIIGARAKGVRSRLRASELSSLPFVGSISKEYEMPYPALKILRSLGIQPAAFIETNNQETQKRVVVNGCGFSIIPRPMIREELISGALTTIDTPKAIGEHLLFVKRKGRNLSKPAAEFKKMLVSELERLDFICR